MLGITMPTHPSEFAISGYLSFNVSNLEILNYNL